MGEEPIEDMIVSIDEQEACIDPTTVVEKMRSAEPCFLSMLGRAKSARPSTFWPFTRPNSILLGRVAYKLGRLKHVLGRATRCSA